MSKRVKKEEISEEFLSKGWSQDTLNEEKGIIFTTASSKTETTGKTWTADQVSQVQAIPVRIFLTRLIRSGGSKRSME
jgi:hypothetical protein